jgi:hypothetical protein
MMGRLIVRKHVSAKGSLLEPSSNLTRSLSLLAGRQFVAVQKQHKSVRHGSEKRFKIILIKNA